MPNVHTIAPRSLRQLVHLLPGSLHQLLMRAYFGDNWNTSGFYLHQQRLSMLLPYLDSRLLKNKVRKGALKLLETSQDDIKEFVSNALIKAIDDNRTADIISIINHCGYNMRTRTSKIISDKYQFVWYRNPKVASTSMYITLLKCDPDAREIPAMMLCYFHENYSWEVQNYLTFGFMRHPMYRIHSCWLDKIANMDNNPEKDSLFINTHHGLSADMDLSAFCEWLMSPWGNDVFCDPHWMSQHHLLTKSNGSTVDFIGKLGNLDDDWRILLERVGAPHFDLPKTNVFSDYAPDWHPNMMDGDLLNRIEDRYGEDYKIGEYQRVGSNK